MTRMISPVLLSLVKAMVILSVGLKGTNLTILYSSHSVSLWGGGGRTGMTAGASDSPSTAVHDTTRPGVF